MYVCIYKDKIFDFKIDVIFGFCILNIYLVFKIFFVNMYVYVIIILIKNSFK